MTALQAIGRYDDNDLIDYSNWVFDQVDQKKGFVTMAEWKNGGKPKVTETMLAARDEVYKKDVKTQLADEKTDDTSHTSAPPAPAQSPQTTSGESGVPTKPG